MIDPVALPFRKQKHAAGRPEFKEMARIS